MKGQFAGTGPLVDHGGSNVLCVFVCVAESWTTSTDDQPTTFIIHASGQPAGCAGVHNNVKHPSAGQRVSLLGVAAALAGAQSEPWSARSVRGERSIVNRHEGRGLAIGREQD